MVIKVTGHRTEAMIEKEVRQECSLSLTFHWYSEQAIKETKEKCVEGITVQREGTKTFMFTDDFVILPETADDLKE